MAFIYMKSITKSNMICYKIERHIFPLPLAKEISSLELVPGDVIFLPTDGGFVMECDSVLVEGTCVVDESMLTGESIPITKVSRSKRGNGCTNVNEI